MPLVSVIASLYDEVNPKFVEKAIKSITEQTFRDLEFIIVLDGVINVNLLKLIELFCEKDKRIKIFKNEKREGLAFSMNKAITYSSGEFLARMDMDDISLPTRIEKQVNCLRTNEDIGIIGTYAYEIDEEDNIIFYKKMPTTYEAIKKFFIKRSPLIHPTVIFRRKVFENIGYYNVNYPYTEDYELIYRAILNNIKIINIPEFLYMFRIDREFYSRRKNFKKGILEAKIKIAFINKYSLPWYTYVYPFSYILLRASPKWFVKLAYKYLR